MLNLEIRRPKSGEIKQLNEILKTVITDMFIKEGIGKKRKLIL